MMYSAVVGTCLLLCLVSGQESDNRRIAFSAGFREDSSIQGDKPVIYKTVFINDGKAYDPATGVFTSPREAVYMFQIYAMSGYNKTLGVSLYHNTQYIISAFAYEPQGWSAGGNSVILRLNQSDKVYVKTRISSFIYGRLDETYATFSGYFLYP